MAQSNAYKALSLLAKQTQDIASNLNASLPQAGAALMHIAMNLAKLNDETERLRIASILDGTYPALQPIKRMLRLNNQKDHLKMTDLMSDDDQVISDNGQPTDFEKMFQRFVGVYYRRMWACNGVEDQVLARRLFLSHPDCMVDGYWISGGDMIFDFDDAGGFRHSLRLNKFFSQNVRNGYKVTSLWMDETFDLTFESIGRKWVTINFIDQASKAFEILPEEYTSIPLDDLLEKVNAIEGVAGIQHFHRMTMPYPGDVQFNLPPGRMDVNYHYYPGSDKYQLTVNFYPERDRYLLGLLPSSHQHVVYENLPTVMQQWVADNVEELILAKLEELNREREGDNS